MNPMKLFCLVACVVAVAAVPSKKNQQNSDLSPSQWLSPSDLQAIPSVDEVSWEQLENWPLEKGAHLIEKIYHLSQINHDLRPAFVPSPSNIPVQIIKSNGERVQTNLNNIASVAKQQPEFGDDEVTILVTGVPQSSPAAQKAARNLVQAYMQRYNVQNQRKQLQNNDYVDSSYSNKQQQQQRSSSEEDYSESWKDGKANTGNLIIIDLGSTLTTFKRMVMLDTVETGVLIAKALVQLTEQADVLHESMHVVAQGVAAHVASAAGQEYTRLTGHKIRRITALDPSKLFAKNPNTLAALSRGDADFVDAIHTSAHGLGTPVPVGNVDFYPNGPSAGVPGANNVIEASMRATRYFAESVRPGNERNFPAVPASSLQEYKQNNGIGKRTYMGIDVDYDLEGDYILQVNPKSPFGQRSPATKQGSYHGVHTQSWKHSSQN